MSLSGRIQSLDRHQRIDRSNERLPSCWICNDKSSPTGRARSLGPPSGSADFKAITPGDAFSDKDIVKDDSLLMVLGEPPGPGLLERLCSAEETGQRVYVLASPAFGQGPERTQLDRLEKARILIRRLWKPIPLSAIVAGRGKRAFLWFGGSMEPRWSWQLALAEQQGKDFFRAILHLFWHGALDEAWTGEGPLRFREPGERPFDALPPGRDAAVRLARADSNPTMPAGDIWHDPDGSLPPDGKGLKILMVPPSGRGQPDLIPFANDGTLVFWKELGLPRFTLGAAGGTLLLRGAEWLFQLALTKDQAGVLRRIVNDARTSPDYSFEVKARIGSIRGTVMLPGSEKFEPVQKDVEINCGAVQAESLREMDSKTPAAFPEAPPLAASVVYRWTVRPPHPPERARDDSLVTQWRDVDASFRERLDRAAKFIARLEQEESALSRAFHFLAGAVLGLGGERRRISGVIEKLRNKLPSSLGPEGAPGALRELDTCEKDLSRIEEGLAEERRRGEEAEDRRQQEERWREKIKNAEKKLPEIRKELDKARKDLSAVEAELGELSKQPSPQESRERKDLEVRKNRLRDDQKKMESNVKRLEEEARDLEAQMGVKFEYRPSKPAPPDGARKAPGTGFVPPPSKESIQRLPAEALPRVGKLMNHQGTRYLVISSWEELGQAESEAKRLNARLVAAKEVP